MKKFPPLRRVYGTARYVPAFPAPGGPGYITEVSYQRYSTSLCFRTTHLMSKPRPSQLKSRYFEWLTYIDRRDEAQLADGPEPSAHQFGQARGYIHALVPQTYFLSHGSP